MLALGRPEEVRTRLTPIGLNREISSVRRN